MMESTINVLKHVIKKVDYISMSNDTVKVTYNNVVYLVYLNNHVDCQRNPVNVELYETRYLEPVGLIPMLDLVDELTRHMKDIIHCLSVFIVSDVVRVTGILEKRIKNFLKIKEENGYTLSISVYDNLLSVSLIG